MRAPEALKRAEKPAIALRRDTVGFLSVNGPNTLIVTNCALTLNSSHGGDNNSGTATVAGLVGGGAGGGIANFLGSSATVSGCALALNEASGGNGNSATAEGSAAVFAGLRGWKHHSKRIGRGSHRWQHPKRQVEPAAPLQLEPRHAECAVALALFLVRFWWLWRLRRARR
jgi:hypothetical protein